MTAGILLECLIFLYIQILIGFFSNFNKHFLKCVLEAGGIEENLEVRTMTNNYYMPAGQMFSFRKLKNVNFPPCVLVIPTTLLYVGVTWLLKYLLKTLLPGSHL